MSTSSTIAPASSSAATASAHTAATSGSTAKPPSVGAQAMRVPAIGRCSAPSGSSSNGKHSGSAGWGPLISVSHSAASATVRVTTPS